MTSLSLLLLPVFLLFAFSISLIKKRPTFDLFVCGIKEGFGLFKEIIPTLLAMFFAVTILKSSGMLEDIKLLLSSAVDYGSLIGDITPLVILRPLTGSGSLALLDSLCQNGADSFSCKMGSVIQGSTDTTFYIISLYFTSVGITKWRHALKAGLLADVVGMTVAIILSLIFL